MYQNLIVSINEVGVCAECQALLQGEIRGKVTYRYTDAGLKISPYFCVQSVCMYIEGFENNRNICEKLMCFYI